MKDKLTLLAGDDPKCPKHLVKIIVLIEENTLVNKRDHYLL